MAGITTIACICFPLAMVQHRQYNYISVRNILKLFKKHYELTRGGDCLQNYETLSGSASFRSALNFYAEGMFPHNAVINTGGRDVPKDGEALTAGVSKSI